MSKRYALKIENVGEDVYILMSRGHHDSERFMEACHAAYPTWPMGHPVRTYWKSVPTRRDGYKCIYSEVEPTVLGAFPVTVSYEDYSEDRWKPKSGGPRP